MAENLLAMPAEKYSIIKATSHVPVQESKSTKSPLKVGTTNYTISLSRLVHAQVEIWGMTNVSLQMLNTGL